jgi:hypothetical protein
MKYYCVHDGGNSVEPVRTTENTRAFMNDFVLLHHDDFAVVAVVAACDFANPKWYSVIFGNATNESYCSSYPAADDGPNSAQIE